jgi:hypothetical protein
MTGNEVHTPSTHPPMLPVRQCLAVNQFERALVKVLQSLRENDGVATSDALRTCLLGDDEARMHLQIGDDLDDSTPASAQDLLRLLKDRCKSMFKKQDIVCETAASVASANTSIQLVTRQNRACGCGFQPKPIPYMFLSTTSCRSSSITGLM